jgi:cell division protein ZapD
MDAQGGIVSPPELNASDTLVEKVLYEQPLNEKVRSFLRMEFLFQTAEHTMAGKSEWDRRQTLATFIDILNLLGRGDVRGEMTKELGHYAAQLGSLRHRDDLDQQRLAATKQKVDAAVMRLNAYTGQPGHQLRDHELIHSIRQRSSITGGTCVFDIPQLHLWLQQPVEAQQANLRQWFSTFDVLREGLNLYLKILRESAIPKAEQSQRGVFHLTFNLQRAPKMVQVYLPANVDIYPEISGGRHRLSIRFMRQSEWDKRPSQVLEDVDFELACFSF